MLGGGAEPMSNQEGKQTETNTMIETLIEVPTRSSDSKNYKPTESDETTRLACQQQLPGPAALGSGEI